MAEKKVDLTARFELASAVVVRPGDTLIVAIDGPLTMDRGVRIRDHFQEHLPSVKTLIVEARQLAVYRSEDGADEQA